MIRLDYWILAAGVVSLARNAGAAHLGPFQSFTSLATVEALPETYSQPGQSSAPGLYPGEPMFRRETSLLDKVRELEKAHQEGRLPVHEHELLNGQWMKDAIRIACEAIGDNPTPQGLNYAHAFVQYWEWVDPTVVKDKGGLSKSQSFFYFMVGGESTQEEKEDFAALMALDSRAQAPPDARSSIVRFTGPMLSLEGAIWLRNFERVDPPSAARRKLPPAHRMRSLAWKCYSNPQAINIYALKVYMKMYGLVHGVGKSFRPVVDFAALDYDYDSELAKLLQEEADFFTASAQGKCYSDLRRASGRTLLIMAADCSIQEDDHPDVDVLMGKRVAQNFAKYAWSNNLPTAKYDTRSDEQKFAAFVRGELVFLTARGLLDHYGRFLKSTLD